jgi:hypothetical protein
MKEMVPGEGLMIFMISRFRPLDVWLLGMGIWEIQYVHCKKSFSIFPSPPGMSFTKLSLGGNNDVI